MRWTVNITRDNSNLSAVVDTRVGKGSEPAAKTLWHGVPVAFYREEQSSRGHLPWPDETASNGSLFVVFRLKSVAERGGDSSGQQLPHSNVESDQQAIFWSVLLPTWNWSNGTRALRCQFQLAVCSARRHAALICQQPARPLTHLFASFHFSNARDASENAERRC